MSRSLPLLCAHSMILALSACCLAEETATTIRFGITADAHLLGRRAPRNEANIRDFVAAMTKWKPDFVIDVGDFACQCGSGQTTPELHDGQLAGLKHHWQVFSSAPCPAYLAMGNHDVGWLRGGEEKISLEDLYERSHGGEDITKAEWLAVTKMPGRYYSFDVRGCHFIVLDGNNWRSPTSGPADHDGVGGAYWIDAAQKAWVKEDLAANRAKLKVVFSHQELHHTPVGGSGEGGDVPFPPVGKEGSYIGNGWELREMFKADERVLACFAGHKHDNRWAVHGGTHYITLAATHRGGTYAKVTISDKLRIEGVGKQRNYEIPLPAALRSE